jgi:hypothetical protein
MTTKPFPQLRRRSILKPSGRNSPPEIRRTHQAWSRLCSRLQGSRNKPSEISPRWVRCFDTFLNDVGPCPEGFRPTRPDPELPLGPGNFIWAAPLGPRNAGRQPKLYALGSEQRTLREWAAHAGIVEVTLRSRLARGIPLEQAIAPIDYRKTA